MDRSDKKMLGTTEGSDSNGHVHARGRLWIWKLRRGGNRLPRASATTVIRYPTPRLPGLRVYFYNYRSLHHDSVSLTRRLTGRHHGHGAQKTNCFHQVKGRLEQLLPRNPLRRSECRKSAGGVNWIFV